MNRKPILCLDFDGVCHRYDAPWIAAHVIPDDPVEGLEDFLLEASKLFRLCVLSSRSRCKGGIDAMRTWFEKHMPGLVDEIDIEFSEEKPPAFMTIDDRAFLFEGKWPDPENLLKFKPWNRKTSGDDDGRI